MYLFNFMFTYLVAEMLSDFVEGWVGVWYSMFYWYDLMTESYDPINKGVFELMLFFFQPWSANVVEKHICEVLDAF